MCNTTKDIGVLEALMAITKASSLCSSIGISEIYSNICIHTVVRLDVEQVEIDLCRLGQIAEEKHFIDLPGRILFGTLNMHIKLWGAAGSSGNNSYLSAGSGGFTEMKLQFKKSSVLRVLVGQGGEWGSKLGGRTTFGGGGEGGKNESYDGNSGGGGTFVFIGNSLADSVILAVAGGGGGCASTFGNSNSAGSGGGILGKTASNIYEIGKGASQEAGGEAGRGGTPGAKFKGGSGCGTDSNVGSGGGGGGYFGGGGGGGRSGAGGGGSGFVNVTYPGFESGETIAGPDAGATRKLPPRSDDPDYIEGVGEAAEGGVNSRGHNGGNGLAVIYVNDDKHVFTYTGDIETLVL